MCFAVDDVEEVVLVPVADVAGVEPALAVLVREGLVVGLRQSVVLFITLGPWMTSCP